ncbi:MAG: glycosyltransferase family 39 protein, partial [Bacteroidota bacterium]
WGFMEVPPLLSVFAWLTNLFGSGMFWIKIWPAIFGALTYLVVGKTILSLGGRSFALILGWLPFMLDGYMRMFFLFQPNFLEVFFWTMIVFSAIRYVQTEKNKWLYIFGISIGLGMMSKYSVSFFTISVLTGLLVSRQRKVYLNKHLYFSLLIAFLIFLPNMLWQYNHRFPVVTHMKELQETQLQYVNPFDFIKSQILMNLACVYIWIGGLLFLIFDSKGKSFRFAGWAWLLVITLLIVLHGKDYYAMGSYPILFAFGGVYLEQLTSLKAKWTRYAMLAFSLALGIFSMPLIMPVAKPEALAKYYEKTHLNKMNKWEDLKLHPLPQDFADMIGWKEMAQKTACVYNSLTNEQKAKTLVFCRFYGSAGALNLYGKEMGLPEVYSDNASFLLWMPDKYDIKNFI